MEKDRDLGSAPLRVGLFIDCYYPMVDGVVHVVDNLARNMIAAGAEVTVFAPTADKKYDDAQLPYRVVRGPSLRVGFMDYTLPLLSFSARFKREIRRAKLDVMHIHAPFVSGPIAEKIAKKQGVPVIGTFHSQYKKDFARYLKSRFLQKRLLSHVVKVFDRCDLVLTMTEATEAVARSYGCKAKIALLPNGTNLKETEKTAAAAAEVAARYRENPRGGVDNPSNLIGIIENTALRLAAGRLCVAGAPLRAERTVPQFCAGRLCTGAGIPQYRKNTATRLAAGRFRVPRQAA